MITNTRVEISQELLATANDNENFLNKIIIGDNTWVYGCDIETKVQSLQWVAKGLLVQTSMVNDQGDVGCVFLLQWHRPPGNCTTQSDGKQRSLPGNSSTFEGSCVQ